MSQHEETVSALLHEERRFEPPAEFRAQANAQPGIYEEASRDRLEWWAGEARRLTWAEPWTSILNWNEPFAKWFVGGKLNVAVNCVDRHVAAGLGDRVAFYWEGEPGDTRTITYADLQGMVCQAANALVELGVQAGETVAIYMPMIPETVVAMLACARLGAPHTVVFGGFSSDALKGRILDCDARTVITADGGYRRGAPSALKPAVDDALADCPAVRKVVVVRRTGQEIGVDRRAGRVVARSRRAAVRAPTRRRSSTPSTRCTSCTPAVPRPSPKGILHTSGGYLTQAATTHRLIFDIKPEKDIYWTAADIGWVTGHSYIVYGPAGQRHHVGHVRGHP